VAYANDMPGGNAANRAANWALARNLFAQHAGNPPSALGANPGYAWA